MLDFLLIPAVLLVSFALRAVHRGEHRLHGHLMAVAFTVVALRMLLWPRAYSTRLLEGGLIVLGLAGATMVLGRMALAWREGRSHRAHIPKVHRALGILTLVTFGLAMAIWLMRNRT